MRVLLAEDDPKLARIISRALSENGYAVDVVGDGQTALSYSKTETYSAVILDVMLPILSGFEVCKAMRSKSYWGPILFLTARSEVDDRVEGLDSGGDDYLIKPFSLVELSARLRALIRRGQCVRPAILEVGDLRLDPASHRVWRGMAEITITAKEFALLELLMRNAGQVLTRIQILDQLWNIDQDMVSNVVDQYIAYLRRRVDKPFARNDIETIRGVGYRLRDPGEPS